MKKGVTIILIILAVAVIIGIIYFKFLFYYKCSDIECFRSHQQKCVKTKFVNNGEEAVWSYRILGKSGGMCGIEATLVQIKKGTLEKNRLNGKSMVCYLDLGSIEPPEKDISKCHGLLREEMQDFMIKQLHSYIVSNVGQVSDELNKVI